MKKIIVGQQGCSKCKMLKDMCPEATYIEPQLGELLAMAQMLDVKSLPIVVCAGEVEDLKKMLNNA